MATPHGVHAQGARLDIDLTLFYAGRVSDEDTPETLSAAVARWGRQQPDAIAAIQDDRTRSWGEFASRIQRLSNALVALGLEPDGRVAMLGRNSIEYGEIFVATVGAQACAVPLPGMASAAALQLMLVDSGARVLFVTREYRDLIAAMVPELDLLPGGLIGIDFHDSSFASYQALIESASDGPLDRPHDPQAGFNIIYSSGTTGTPKGILHTNRMRHSQMLGFQAFGMGPASVNAVTTPLYANTSLVVWLPGLYYGATSTYARKFDTEAFLASIETHRVTHVMLVPVQYDRILRHERFAATDKSSLQWKFCTSAPLREELKRKVVETFPGEFAEFYGLTEGGVSTLLFGNQNKDKLASVGKCYSGELRIIDDQGNQLPTGQTGEIVGRNDHMMKGYVNRDEETRAMLWEAPDGTVFLRSGDVGRLDEDGFLYLSDRKKDMIISGGLNIYATDLEIVLGKHPDVQEVAVISIPSDAWGETPLALVVLEPAAVPAGEAQAAALCDWANERLGKSQRISRVEFRQNLPKSPIGKILKRQLRAPFWDEAQTPEGSGFDSHHRQ